MDSFWDVPSIRYWRLICVKIGRPLVPNVVNLWKDILKIKLYLISVFFSQGEKTRLSNVKCWASRHIKRIVLSTNFNVEEIYIHKIFPRFLRPRDACSHQRSIVWIYWPCVSYSLYPGKTFCFRIRSEVILSMSFLSVVNWETILK